MPQGTCYTRQAMWPQNSNLPCQEKFQGKTSCHVHCYMKRWVQSRIHISCNDYLYYVERWYKRRLHVTRIATMQKVLQAWLHISRDLKWGSLPCERFYKARFYVGRIATWHEMLQARLHINHGPKWGALLRWRLLQRKTSHRLIAPWQRICKQDFT